MAERALHELVDRIRQRFPDSVDTSDALAGIGVRAITEDSRTVEPGSVFCARRGTSADGHDHIGDAVERGAVAIVAEERRTDAVPTLLTPDSARFTGLLAAEFFGRPSAELDLVGVTGTNGKTTVVTLLAHVVRHAGRSSTSMGTLTGSLTTPPAPEFQSLLRRAVDVGTSMVAAEVSSHALDQRRVDGSEFRIAIFTNLSQDHLDYHHDMERYFGAKARLFSAELSRVGVVDIACPYGRRLAETAEIPIIAIDSSAVENVEIRSGRSSFAWRDALLDLPLGGRFNVANALLVAVAAAELGIDEPAIVDALAATPQVPGRFESVNAGQPFGVVVDYSHTPAGLEAAIDAAREMTDDGRVIVVFGAAGDRDRGKRPLMGAAASAADVVFVTSDNPRTEDPESIIDEVLAGVDHARVHRDADRRASIVHAIGEAGRGDVVLIAGKGHEDYQIIGTTRRDFDDRVEARRALAALGWEVAA